MKLYVLSFFYFISLQTFATTCFTTDEMRTKYNEKYGAEISIEAKLDLSSYYVVISAPQKLNSVPLTAFHLSADELDNPTFSAPLNFFEEDGKFITWFEIDANLIRKHFVTATYGSNCGFDVTKEVLYQ
jgi:hypothetical protein